MAKKAFHLLPDAPWEETTRRERMRAHWRSQAQRLDKAGMVLAQGWVLKIDVEYLMAAWSLGSRHQLVRVALRHLLRQTQRGLPHLDGPPEGYG